MKENIIFDKLSKSEHEGQEASDLHLKIPFAVASDTRLMPIHKLVYGLIKTRCFGARKVCTVSQKTMAALLGCSLDNIKISIKVLRELGLITTRLVKTDRGWDDEKRCTPLERVYGPHYGSLLVSGKKWLRYDTTHPRAAKLTKFLNPLIRSMALKLIKYNQSKDSIVEKRRAIEEGHVTRMEHDTSRSPLV